MTEEQKLKNNVRAKQWYQDHKEEVKIKQKERDKQRYLKDKEILLEKNKQWQQEHREERNEYAKQRYQNKEEVREKQKQYNLEHKEERKEKRELNKEKIKEQGKRWREENKDKIKEKHKQYYDNNKDLLAKKKQEYRKNNKNKVRNREKIYQKSPKGRFATYKSQARVRKLNFDLSYDEFMTFWQQPCSYCGDPIETIGIDRVNNTIGYKINNCVSCCFICNQMKMNFGIKEWEEQMKKILAYRLGRVVFPSSKKGKFPVKKENNNASDNNTDNKDIPEKS